MCSEGCSGELLDEELSSASDALLAILDAVEFGSTEDSTAEDSDYTEGSTESASPNKHELPKPRPPKGRPTERTMPTKSMVGQLPKVEVFMDLDVEASVGVEVASKEVVSETSISMEHHGAQGAVIGKNGTIVRRLEGEHGVKIEVRGDRIVISGHAGNIRAAEEKCKALLSVALKAERQRCLRTEQLAIQCMAKDEVQAELELHREAAALKKRLRRARGIKKSVDEGKFVEANQKLLMQQEECIAQSLQEVKEKMATSECSIAALKSRIETLKARVVTAT